MAIPFYLEWLCYYSPLPQPSSVWRPFGSRWSGWKCIATSEQIGPKGVLKLKSNVVKCPRNDHDLFSFSQTQ